MAQLLTDAQLDAAVARAVFGCRVAETQLEGRRGWVCCCDFAPHGGGHLAEIKPYSRDLVLAWQLVERVTDPRVQWPATGRVCPPNTAFLRWWREADVWAYSAQEAAERLCNAALEAVGGQP